MTCRKAQGFLAKAKADVVEQVDAKRATIKGDRIGDVLRDVDELYATKGKNIAHVDLRRERPDGATLKSLMVGPSGNLRALTVRVGRTLLVGFDEATYKRVLGASR